LATVGRFWLSFCDPDKPEGERFLGAAIVEATDLREALKVTWRLKINPGGEVLSVEIPDDVTLEPNDCMNRLLTKAEAEAVRRKE
jgi:ABC-type proline/glycine betaine transport system ATPase subunit